MRIACTAWLALCLGTVMLGCKKRSEPASAETQDKPAVTIAPTAPTAGKRGTFTIGKNTTFVTGPVDSDGCIDYIAALNDRLSEGVAPESNANVAIWKVIGPNSPGDVKIPPGFFERMGTPAPPAGGEYFVGLKAYCDQHAPGQVNALAEAMAKSTAQPWIADQNPILDGWLWANEKPLAALREAVKQPRYYNPLLPEHREKGLIGTLHPGLEVCRQLAGALTGRAMLYLGHGNPAAAWQDLLACYRLGRQIGQGGTLIEGVVSLAIEQLAARGAAVFLGAANPDAKAVEGCLRDLYALPRTRPAAEQIDLAERMWALDTIMQFDRHGPLQVQIYDDKFQPMKHGLSDEVLDGIDWNPALELANRGTDRLAAIFRTKDRTDRVRQLAQLLAETRPHYDRFVSGQGAALLKGAASASERGRLFGEMLRAYLPLMTQMNDAIDRTQQTFDTTAVAFALVWYQRVNGRYPDTLAKLAPTYLTAVPGDLFSAKEMIYKPTASGFLLYSVGVNGTDDGGRNFDGQPPGDDIVVRVSR